MPRRALFLLLALFALLAACGRSAPTRYYLLQSAQQPVKADSLPAKNLRVAQVNVPEYMDRNGIVSRVNGSSELVVAQFHAWAEPVSNGVRRVVQEVLTPPLLAAGVSVLAPGDDARGGYVLLLDVLRLDGILNEKSVLETRWTIRNSHDDLIARGIYADEEMVSGPTHNALVDAESHMLRRMGAHLAERLPQLMRGKP